MVHSVELLFDPETEQAIRATWDALTDIGVMSLASHPATSNRPHVTLTVALHMDDAVNGALRPLLPRLPVTCTVGAPMIFGRGPFILVRQLVPSLELLNLQADVHAACLPHIPSGPLPHATPGNWTPHVTLARRIASHQLAAAMSLSHLRCDLTGNITGLRHWDGNSKREFPIN